LNFKVAVFGCGYVGSEIIKALVECGDDVLGLDPNQVRLDELADLFHLEMSSGRLRLEVPSKNLPKSVFDFVVITVPTPLDDDGTPSLKFVEQAANLGVDLLNPKGVIVLESTSYPGTTRQVFEAKLSLPSQQGKTDVQGFGFSSERIDPGNTKFGLRDVPKVISGSDQLTMVKIYNLYSRFVNVVVQAETIEDAEATTEEVVD
jgi:UDP-N-acetyl-D-glucosamine dehydrogenase